MTRRNSRRRTVTPLAALALGITATVLYGGPLNPPGGPIVSTTGPEPRIAVSATNTPGDADSLFKITQPGSYYLTGNITGVAGKHGVEIGVSGVTLDLNGFSLVGVAGMGLFDGVNASGAGLSNIAVVNGSLRNWGDEGVDLTNVKNCRTADLLVSGNAFNGIIVGEGGAVTNCSAGSNGGSGIVAFSFGTITNCVAMENAAAGFSISIGTAVTGCTARGNTSDGIFGSNGCTITNCSVHVNLDQGINVGPGSTITGSVVAGSANVGISAGDGCTITDCSLTSNGASGISAGVGTAVTNCTVRTSTGTGITVQDDSTVTGCTVSGNATSGVLVTRDCVVSGNTCNGNGTATTTGAGILATAVNNRIDGNNCSNNDRGIECAGGGNLIIRNSASSNTINFLFVANNRYGPIVDITSATAAVSGNTAPSTLTTTEPNANFRY